MIKIIIYTVPIVVNNLKRGDKYEDRKIKRKSNKVYTI